MIGDLALGALLAAAGVAMLVRPKLGFKLLISVVFIMVLLFCSFFIGFL